MKIIVAANLVLALIGTIAMVATAYATYRTWSAQRRKALAEKPTLSEHLKLGREFPHEVHFNVSDDHAAIWRIESIRAHYLWRPLISKPDGGVQSSSGAMVGYNPTKWQKVIRYDSSERPFCFLIRLDCPDVISLSARLAMKASPKETSLVPMRIRIRD